VAYPFIYNLPPKLASSWFPHKEQKVSLTISISSFLIGCIFAYSTSLFIMTNFLFNDSTPEGIHSKMQIMLIGQLILMLVVWILVLYLFEEMYFNKFGQFSPQKDDLSDFNSKSVNFMEYQNQLLSDKPSFN